MRSLVAAVLALSVAGPGVAVKMQQTQDPAAILAAARAALGGDALLNGITSFTVNG